MLSRELNRWTFSEVTIVGHSPAIREIVEFIERLAGRGGPTTVLIRGESGTGKDVVARAIHARGPRRDGAFIDVNCTALPEQLLESELFGHEAGAFTDAKSSKRGLVELAEGGTIFLDEIGEMPISAQAKLLRFIEARRFRRVGGIRDLEVDVQVLVATNRNLEEAVERGGFREDLFYRLNVVPIVLPPLRQRREDIAPLTTLFIEQLASGMRRPGPEVSVGAMRLMESYDWPGNARQIRNILERIMLFYDVDRIQPEHLPPEIGGVSTEEVLDFVLPSEGVDLEEIQKSLIEQALARAGGNKTEAARLLGISRDTLRYRLEKYQIGQNQ
jgi:transcriptional regulator with PAS, ATPase and Fis domain